MLAARSVNKLSFASHPNADIFSLSPQLIFFLVLIEAAVMGQPGQN